MTLQRRSVLGGLAAVGLAAGCTTTPTSRADLETRSRAALALLETQVPAAKALAQSSKAYLIFPGITQGSFIFGGQFGEGVLFKQGVPAGFFNVTGGSWGLQAGAQTFSQGYFFTTDEALRTFESTNGLQLGAGVDFAVASRGASGEITTTTLQRPIVVFVWGQAGLAAGVNITGQRIARMSDRP